MELYRCECGTLCRPPEGAVAYTCADCGKTRETPAQAQEQAPVRVVKTAAKETAPEPEDVPANE